ncbi:hypothetical protein Tco_1496485, partial [Tanacetum coccineum]
SSLHSTLMAQLEKNEEDIDDDEYWEKKLPDEYQRYIEMSDMPLDYTTKKDLYLSLCQGFLGCNGQVVIHSIPSSSSYSCVKTLYRNICILHFKDFMTTILGQTQAFPVIPNEWVKRDKAQPNCRISLCKSTSGICSILPAAHIISPNRNLETRYLSQSRFKEVVRLEIQYDYCFSCRLGSFMFSPHHTYACYLVFRYKDNQVPSNDASFYTSKCNSRDNIMIQGMEFRPVVHDGSYLMAERLANRNVIETTHLHGTSDHDKNEDEYWELPHNYPHLIEISDIPLNYTTKKELYFLFRHGFLANNGQLVILYIFFI